MWSGVKFDSPHLKHSREFCDFSIAYTGSDFTFFGVSVACRVYDCRKLPLATAYSIRYQETVVLTPHQEYCQFNQHRTTSTNAYKQYITVRLKLTSHIFDHKSTCLQQTYVLIKRTTGHLQYAFSICVCNTCWKSTNCCNVRM